MEPAKKIPLTMITGNKKKLEEFVALMGEDLAAHYNISSAAIDCNTTRLTQ